MESLHEIGSERDKAGNRDLHMDQYCVLVLMWLFNPILTSLRGLQQASTLATETKSQWWSNVEPSVGIETQS